MEANSVTNSRLKGMTLGKAFGGALKMVPIGLNIGFPVMTYFDQREQGASQLKAGAIAGGELAAWSVMPGVMLAASMADVGSDLVKTGLHTAQGNRDYVSKMYQANFGGNYVDNNMAGTMRQAGMYSIQQSKANVQSSLGTEAKSFYRRSR
jgi:hypothetical protein